MFGTKSQPLAVKNVSFNDLKEMSSIVKERGRYQKFDTVEEQLGRVVEEKVKLLISLLEGVEEVHLFQTGTVADDDLKIDCGVKFVWDDSIFLFQIKSSEVGANQHFQKYGKGVQALIRNKKVRFDCPGVFYLSPKQTNLIDVLYMLRDWFPVYPGAGISAELDHAVRFYDAVMKKNPGGVKVSSSKLEMKLTPKQINYLFQLGVTRYFVGPDRNKWIEFLK